MSITTDTGYFRAADKLLAQGHTPAAIEEKGELYRERLWNEICSARDREEEYKVNREWARKYSRDKFEREEADKRFYDKHQTRLF